VWNFLTAIRLTYDFSKKTILDAEVSQNTPLYQSLRNSMNTVPSSEWNTKSTKIQVSREEGRAVFMFKTIFPETLAEPSNESEPRRSLALEYQPSGAKLTPQF
jgi:hypothetical protein